ncbi:hypothetical protein C1631_013275 [Chryseobacterium phosphatilyticum]|uniref:Uncharacterized protein n=1 Tax=Chryseobacterium phosphatilyticum TaxID=475075 RepID=A0A316X5F0_9FLAO|nr:hypothetical protein [Chryseobacterium phosphatilyticum]PWN69035.1 hypothetical protein C1631_013275 [Chryseobacterium phosphatilyticum]
MRVKLLYLVFILLVTAGLSPAREKAPLMEAVTKQDTMKLRATFNEEDILANEYLKKRLKPIQTNFKRINSIRKWSSVKKKNIEGESAEGGEATFYYKDNHLEKVMARHYGEMGQVLIEYYLLKGRLSFVFEKDYQYNRPMFYDVKAMKESGDIEAFDFKKSEITETRNYFEKGNLIHIVNSQDCGAPFSEEYTREEEKSITEGFERLLKLSQEKE